MDSSSGHLRYTYNHHQFSDDSCCQQSRHILRSRLKLLLNTQYTSKTHYQAHMFDSASCSARQEGLYHKYQPSQGHCNYLQHHMEHDCSSLREQDAEWECQQQRCSICSILTGDNLLLLSNPKQIFPNIKMLLIICSS